MKESALNKVYRIKMLSCLLLGTALWSISLFGLDQGVQTLPELGRWEIACLKESGKTLDTSDKTSDTRCMVLVNNDKLLFIHARKSKNVVVYELEEAGDLSTAKLLQELDTSPYFGSGSREDAVGHGIYVKRDTMDKLWLWNRTELWQLDLSNPGDLSSITQSKSKDLSDQVKRGHAIIFAPDGLAFYVEDRGQGKVHQYALSSPWDIDTLTKVQELDISARHKAVRGIEFDPEGKTMYLLDTSLREVQQYRLGEAWQVSTAVFEKALPINNSNPRGITWNSTGEHLYITNAKTGVITQYDVVPVVEP